MAVEAVPLREHEHDPRTLEAAAAKENFPVATRLLPSRYRGHLMAVYGFARMVDDIGDEAPPGERPALLDEVERDLDRVYAGGRARLPVMRRLAETVRDRGVPDGPFRALLQANRQDQQVLRYGTFDELMAYCALSADPVGHIVLYVFGAATPARLALSDRICSALQILEHCQDVGEDHARGRVYLPADDLRRFGCEDGDLAARSAPTRLRGVIALEAGRARRMIAEGEPIVDGLGPWARLAVSGFVGGGRATHAAIVRDAYDVLGARPRPRPARLLNEWLRVLARTPTANTRG